MRRVAICKDTAGGLHCSVVVAGDEEDQVVETTAEHQVQVHGIADTPAMRRAILEALLLREALEPEDDWEVIHARPMEDADVEDEAAVRRP